MRTRKKDGSFESKYNENNFIEKLKEKHGDKYDYKFAIFSGYHKKKDILCKKHGIFSQSIKDHINGRGCILCGRERCSQSKLKSSEYFVNKAKNIFGDKYDYSKTIYTGKNCEVIIICKKHGDFTLKASSHISKKHECDKCIKTIHNEHNKNIFLQIARKKTWW